MNRSDIFFSSRDRLKDLGGRTARGGSVSMGAQAVRLVIQTGNIIVLARFLTPDDFGVVGMVTVLLQLVVFFRDFGLTQATVQQLTITRYQISNVFWINAIISLLIALAAGLCAPLIADFYDKKELIPIVWVIAIGIMIEGFGLQHSALMMRVLQFNRLAVAEISSQVISVAIAVSMAWMGFGYWSLVALNVSSAACRTLFYWISTGWIPNWPRRGVETKPFIRYGGNLLGFNMVNYFTRNTDTIVIGKFMGADALGLYNNAYRLLVLPMSQLTGPLNRIFLPSLSQLQNDPKRFTQVYYKFMRLTTMLTMPLAVFVIASADNLIPALLGPQWAPAVIILQAFGLAGLCGAINTAGGLVLMSTGRTGRLFGLGIFCAIITVAGFVIAIPYGVVGIAVSFSITQLIVRCVDLVVCFRGSLISVGGLLKIIAPQTLLALFSGGIIYLGARCFKHDNYYLDFGLQIVVFAMLYGTGILLIGSCREAVKEFIKRVLHRERAPSGEPQP